MIARRPVADLRALAQSADDAFEAWRADRCDPSLRDACEAAEVALGLAVGASGPLLWPVCLRIIAALNAAEARGEARGDAQGYARAMGEVVAFDERDPCPVCDVGDWARERAAAAARD